MAHLALYALTKVFPNGVRAVSEVNLAVADGELMVLMGPSGCGKTTILRLLAGLESPTSGSIALDGRVVNDWPPRRRNLALVFQRPPLYPHLTVRRNMFFGIHMRRNRPWRERLAGLVGWSGRPGEEAQLQETAGLLGLERLLDRYPHQLSGGQQQRVAIGRALMREPAGFLLDEPLSNLDSPTRDELRLQLHLLQRKLRVTMVFVTHDPHEALSLGDRLVVLRDGAVEQAGPPREVYDRPCNRFVATFLGRPPMNILDGRLTTTPEDLLQFEWSVGTLGLAGAPQWWKRWSGHSVGLGVSPENVLIRKANGGPRLEVALVELSGRSWFATLRAGDSRIVARVTDEREVHVGQRVGVALNPNQLHLFDAVSGVRLADSG